MIPRPPVRTRPFTLPFPSPPFPSLVAPCHVEARKSTIAGALTLATPPPMPPGYPFPIMHILLQLPSPCWWPSITSFKTNRILRVCAWVYIFVHTVKREEQTQSPASVAPGFERGAGVPFEDPPQRGAGPVRPAHAHPRREAQYVRKLICTGLKYITRDVCTCGVWVSTAVHTCHSTRITVLARCERIDVSCIRCICVCMSSIMYYSCCTHVITSVSPYM